MYGALYTKPIPTLGEVELYNASGVTKMAKAVCDSLVESASTRCGPVGLVSHVRRLLTGAVLKTSSSTGDVKPRAPKKEPISLLCSVSCNGDL